jgi:hypothetical protein
MKNLRKREKRSIGTKMKKDRSKTKRKMKFEMSI